MQLKVNMIVPNAVRAILQSLTYAAQFSHPMKDGIDRVFDRLIVPKLVFQSPANWLNQIIDLLKIAESFEGMAPTTIGHSDKEIRDFLVALANEIEARFAACRRSGNPATLTGEWLQFNVPDNRRIFEKSHLLPSDNGQTIVWEYVEPIVSCSAQEIILNEFSLFYRRGIVAGASRYSDFNKYADASAKRILKQLQEGCSTEVACLLSGLSENPDHALLKEIQVSTNINWTHDPEKFKWLSQVFRGIAMHLNKAG